VTYGDRSGDVFLRSMVSRPRVANALHHAGRRAEAEARFREAEQMQAERQPEYPLLYSDVGFMYCDLLLAMSERAAWRHGLQLKTENRELQAVLEACRAIEQRAAQTLPIAERNNWLLDIALDHLTLGRAAIYRAILEESAIRNPQSEIETAVDGLRRAGVQNYVARGLLTRAWLRFLEGDADGARADLDEAWEIAERGPMRLFMADIHLYRARLFGSLKCEVRSVKYPWESPQADLAAARKLIEQCGYHRRDEELADAEEAATSW
jgi:tetratricopeptide (TPR) repeat protein